MQEKFSYCGRWLRQSLVACGVGSVLVLGGCELGAPPIDEQKDAKPKTSLVDQYKQANKESRDPGLAASPGQLGGSLLDDPDAMKKGADDLGNE